MKPFDGWVHSNVVSPQHRCPNGYRWLWYFRCLTFALWTEGVEVKGVCICRITDLTLYYLGCTRNNAYVGCQCVYTLCRHMQFIGCVRQCVCLHGQQYSRWWTNINWICYLQHADKNQDTVARKHLIPLSFSKFWICWWFPGFQRWWACGRNVIVFWWQFW